MYFQQGASEQETLPISAVAFRHYLEKYQIEPGCSSQVGSALFDGLADRAGAYYQQSE
ncbi:MAG TPA: hypothetical protein VNE38_07470 [Ktedonobacteraceae bacterium]|nr:hypothetical protein [Ktedonobacteraceae bacterium]